VALVIVELDVALTVVGSSPQVQVAVGLVVTIWLAIAGAPQPPRRSILSAPRALLGILAVHGTLFTAIPAPLASIAATRHIDDEVWRIHWRGRLDECSPVSSTCW